jgi:hypothetical protein
MRDEIPRTFGQAATLPERRGQAVALRDSGLTYKKVGEALGVTPERARMMVAAGRRRDRDVASRAAKARETMA